MQEKYCISDGKLYLSNPPQHKCKDCGTFWIAEAGVKTPICKIQKYTTPQDLLNQKQKITMKKIYKYPTGAEIPEGAVYLSTIVQRKAFQGRTCVDCHLVWHYFLVEVKE